MSVTQSIDSNVLGMIGNTPLLHIDGIYAKIEVYNSTGSVKDRMAWYMVRRAEERGELRAGSEIIEVTSGNTGIALAMVSAIRGYKFTAVMPENMSVERIRMMQSFGANLVLTPALEDMAGACRAYEELKERRPDAWYPCQFANPDNVEAHRVGIGKEIVRHAEDIGPIDALVAGIGTGGTLIGIGIALREVYPDVKIIGVEPAESAVLNDGPPGVHQIEGIGEGFIPTIVAKYRGMIDDVIAIHSKEAFREARRLAVEHGLLVGTSSGANMLAAKKTREKYRTVVTVLPDRGERYLSRFEDSPGS